MYGELTLIMGNKNINKTFIHLKENSQIRKAILYFLNIKGEYFY